MPLKPDTARGTTVPPRRSARLRSLSSRTKGSKETSDDPPTGKPATKPATTAARRKKRPRSTAAPPGAKTGAETEAPPSSSQPKQRRGSPPSKSTPPSLPRTREAQLLSNDPTLVTIGVDEAGRGPLAGPVVAAAAYVPTTVPGVTDSKQISGEAGREEVYHRIVGSAGVRWAVAVVDARRIDEVNILEATMEAMREAVRCIVRVEGVKGVG